jgi:hypothetical protein
MRARRFNLTILAAALVVLAMAVVAVAATTLGGGSKGARDDGSEAPFAHPATPVAGLDPVLVRSFAAFRRGRTDSDTITADVANAIDAGVAQQAGLNVALARAVGGSRASGFAIPGNGVVCLAEATGSGSCSTVAAAATGRQVTIQRCGAGLASGQFGVSGLMPDGVSQVKVTSADGSSVTSKVESNAYMAKTASAPRTLSWTTSDGAQRVTLATLPDTRTPCASAGGAASDRVR